MCGCHVCACSMQHRACSHTRQAVCAAEVARLPGVTAGDTSDGIMSRAALFLFEALARPANSGCTLRCAAACRVSLSALMQCATGCLARERSPC